MPPPCQQHPAAGRSTWGQYAVDALFALIFATLAATYATAAQRAMDPRFFAIPAGNDVWFEGDLPMVADTILHRWSTHPRDAKHPLFPLLTTLPSYGLRAIGLTGPQRLLAITAVAAAAWGGAVYLLLRLSTSSRRAAVVFAALTHVTAGAVFWLPTTETWVLDPSPCSRRSYSWPPSGVCHVREGWYVAASALSLSVTVSNWLAGIIAPLSTRPTRRTYRSPRMRWRGRGAVGRAEVAGATLVVLCRAASSVRGSCLPWRRADRADCPRARVSLDRDAAGRGRARAEVGLEDERAARQPRQFGNDWDDRDRALVDPARVSACTPCGSGAAPRKPGRWGWRPWRSSAVYLCYGEETFLFAIQIAPLLMTCAATATWTRHRAVGDDAGDGAGGVARPQQSPVVREGDALLRADIRFGPGPRLMPALGAYAVWAALAVAALAIVRAQRRRPAAWQSPAIATVATASAIAFAIVSWGRATPLGDFNKAYYPAGAMILSDPSRLYECDVSNLCFVNLPLVALLFTPLTMMARLPAQLRVHGDRARSAVDSGGMAHDSRARRAWRHRSAIVAAFALNGPLLYSIRLGNLTTCCCRAW